MTADGPISGDIDPFSAHRREIDSPDWKIADLANRQHGVAALHQLCSAGLSASAVRKRGAMGRLHRVHQGVYAAGHPLLTADGRWMAAVLACGPEAVLSHRSAAALWGLRSNGRTSIDVMAPGRRGRAPAGIDAHRYRSLGSADRTSVRGIPCTSVARTLLDLAAVVGARELRNAITEAEVLRIFDLAALREVLARSRGRRGVAKLRLLISEFDPRIELTRSELERRFLGLCARSGLPRPEVNVPIELDGGGVIADFLRRSGRLVVEADGRRFHGTATAFERDRLRDQRLMLAGWRVMRCTWTQVVDRPARLAGTIRALLDADRTIP